MRAIIIYLWIGLNLLQSTHAQKPCSNVNMFKSIQYQLKLVENTDSICNDNHGFKIGFLVTNSKPLQNIKDGTDVVYDEVITNTGNGYDVTTGKFKAPVQGLYFFIWTSLTHSQKIFATELEKNGKVVARNHATARGISDQISATQSVVLQLTNNDIVNIKVLKNYTGTYLAHENWSTFSGFRI